VSLGMDEIYRERRTPSATPSPFAAGSLTKFPLITSLTDLPRRESGEVFPSGLLRIPQLFKTARTT
jgi:hypothetical protein